jgi:hypothetical protein
VVGGKLPNHVCIDEKDSAMVRQYTTLRSTHQPCSSRHCRLAENKSSDGRDTTRWPHVLA